MSFQAWAASWSAYTAAMSGRIVPSSSSRAILPSRSPEGGSLIIAPDTGVDSLPRVVLPFGVALELFAVEVDLAEVAGRVAGRLVVEVRGGGVAAFATGGHGAGVYAGSEFDDGDEAVAARAVPLPGARIGLGTEGGERSPSRGREADRDARFGVVEVRVDVVVDPLESVDVAPGRLPAPEIVGQ